MLDSNVFDLLDEDEEVALELGERRDLLCMVTPVQLAQLSAVPDAPRRERLVALAEDLCRLVAAPASGEPGAAPSADKHDADRLIAAASEARCDYLVTDDQGLLVYARDLGIAAMDWRRFRRLVLRIR